MQKIKVVFRSFDEVSSAYTISFFFKICLAKFVLTKMVREKGLKI